MCAYVPKKLPEKKVMEIISKLVQSLQEKAAEESCKANDDVFEDGLEDCHLE
jgi:hypothetical protein